jgi:hypothetical protein
MIKWDILFLKPLHEVYGALKPDCNYASIFGDFAYANQIQWYWIREQMGVETEDMLEDLKKAGRPVDIRTLSFGVMGGCVLSRKFLDLYAAKPVSCHSNDETRLSVYSAAFGIPLLDNGLKRDKRNRFNADNEPYGEEDLDAVLAAGGSVIHPLRVVIDGIGDRL